MLSRNMFLQAGSEYALRARQVLGREYGDGLKPLHKIAAQCQVSENYLYKLCQKLKKRGILNGFPGPKRGFQLSRAPEEVTLLEVIEAIQGPVAAYLCVENEGNCDRAKVCVTKDILEEASGALCSVFQRYTLADILQDKAN